MVLNCVIHILRDFNVRLIWSFTTIAYNDNVMVITDVYI